IDSELQWTGGKTHLVQMGDMIDRGADTRKVLDLLMQLEGQAQAAGGAVHALIGNHEAMNIYGDLRYVSPESYETFHDGNSEKIRDVFYQRHLKELAADPENKGGPIPNAADREAWDKEHPLGYFESRYFFGPNGRYGKWIQQHNTVIQINGTIFCHAGISPKYADMDFNTINERVRAELQDFSKLDGGIVRDEEGPLWYRGWAKESETVLGDDLNRFLESHGAQRMVIGHTPTDGAVIPRFSGRILMVDVGLSAYYGSRLACLVIDDDVAFALHRGIKLEIPTEPGLPLLQYLKKAAALDPPPSPLLPVIEKIEEQISVPSP
ncbi:MAG: metallophosphoesterase, partial [Acidobacteriota bacterium]